MSEFWDRELEPGYYDKLLKISLGKKRGFQPNWHRFTMENLSIYLEKDTEHLDYACGPGTLIGLFSKANSMGVDLSKIQIKYAKENYEGNFLALSEFEYKKYKNHFDTVTIVGLLEFLDYEDIQRLMGQILYILKKNGQVVITTPNFSSVFKSLMKASIIMGKKNYSSIYKSRFRRKSLKDFLNNLEGFQVVRVYKILNLGLFVTIFSTRLGLKIEKLLYKIMKKNVGLLLVAHLIKK